MPRVIVGKKGGWGTLPWLALVLAGASWAAIERRRRRLDLRGRVAIVTGGARGLGLTITRALVRQGCRVAICGRDAEIVQRCVEQLRAEGATVLGQGCDVSDPSQAGAFVNTVVETYGTVDVLVNNAAQCYVGPAPELDALDMQHALAFGGFVGWIVWRTGSVWPGVATHVVNNTASTLLPAWGVGEGIETRSANAIACVVGFVVLAAAIAGLRRVLPRTEVAP